MKKELNLSKFIFDLSTKDEYSKLPIEYLDNRLLEYAIENRVLPIVLQSYQNIEFSSINWEKYKYTLDKKHNEYLKVFNLFNEIGIKYLCLKGYAMRKYYKENIIRHSNDLDLLVSDIDEFWKCYKLLVKLGFNISYFPVFTKFKEQTVGMIKFSKNLERDITVSLEINVSGFSIGELSWFNSKKLWESNQIVTIDNVPIPVPSDEMNMIIFIIEASGRDMPMLRDVIDFHYLYKKTQNSIDFREFRKNLPYKHLINVMNEFVKNENADNSRNIKANRYNSIFFRELFHFRMLYHGKLHFDRLIYYYTDKFGRKIKDTNKDIFLQLVKKIDSKLIIKKRFNLGIPTHFVPFNTDVYGKWHWIEEGNINLVITPIGIFVATNFALFKESELENIKNIIEEYSYANISTN